MTKKQRIFRISNEIRSNATGYVLPRLAKTVRLIQAELDEVLGPETPNLDRLHKALTATCYHGTPLALDCGECHNDRTIEQAGSLLL